MIGVSDADETVRSNNPSNDMIAPQTLQPTMKELLRQYGQDLPSEVNRLQRLKRRRAQLLNNCAFLQRCRRYGVTPRGLQIRSPVDHSRLFKAERSCVRSLIDKCYAENDWLGWAIGRQWAWLESRIPQSLFGTVLVFVQRDAKAHMERIRKKQQAKFDRLCPAPVLWRDKRFRNSLINNMTDVVFDETELDILALGPKFALMPDGNQPIDVAASIEHALYRAKWSNARRDEIIRAVAPVLSSSATRKSSTHEHIARSIKSVKRKLRLNRIRLVMADKGGQVCVINNDTYDDKILAQLSSDQFQPLRANAAPFNAARAEMVKILKPVLNPTNSTHSPIERLVPTVEKCRVPTPYGLLKVHKPDTPLRLIIPACTSVTNTVAQHICRMLRPMVEEQMPYRLSSSAQFVQHLRSLQEHSADSHMVSYDVTALFDHVDVDTVIASLPSCFEYCRQKWINEWSPLTRLSNDALVQLASVVLRSSFCQYNGRTYRQVKGVPMGGSLSVTAAEIFMNRLETALLGTDPTCMKQASVLYYGRYIDDVFGLLVDKESSEQLHKTLNAQSPNIQFTVEHETNRELAFLDVHIVRNREGFTTGVYRKATHSDRTINPLSFHPLSVTSSTISTMRRRAFTLCSNQDETDTELKRLMRIFVRNGHDPRKVHALLFEPTYGPRNKPENEANCVLPFNSQTQILKAILARHGIGTFFKCHATTATLYNKRDTLPNKRDPEQSVGVVYRINCANCTMCYVGETTRKLRTRLSEHSKAVTRNQPSHSAWVEHVISTGHQQGTVDIIDRDSNECKLRIKESLHIITQQQRLPQNDTSYPISTHWISCLPMATTLQHTQRTTPPHVTQQHTLMLPPGSINSAPPASQSSSQLNRLA